MKWKKLFCHYLVFVLLYVIFTMLCIAWNFAVQGLQPWVYVLWYSVTGFFLFVTAVIWVALLQKIMK